MESKSRRDEPDEWWLGIELHAGEITELLEIAFALVAADAEPIVDGLNGQLNIFGCFQFDYDETATARDAEKIDHAAISGC